MVDFALLGGRYRLDSLLTKQPPLQNVVVIEIDDASLKANEDPWPWPRGTIARLVDICTNAEVAAMGMDLFFASPKERDPEGDRQLQAALLRSPRDVLAASISQADTSHFLLPWEGFQKAVSSVGAPAIYLNPIGEPTLIGVHSQGQVQGKKMNLHGFPIEVMGVSMGDTTTDSLRFEFSPDLSFLLMDFGRTSKKRVKIPLQTPASLEPNFRYLDAFERVSAQDLLTGAVPPTRLKGKLTLIGVTAQNTSDRFTTPVGRTVGGVELHALLISCLLDGSWLRAVDPVVLLLLLLIAGFLQGLLGLFMRPRAIVVLGSLILVVWWGVAIHVFSFSNIEVPLTRPTGLFLLLMAAGLLRYRFRTLVEMTDAEILAGGISLFGTLTQSRSSYFSRTARQAETRVAPAPTPLAKTPLPASPTPVPRTHTPSRGPERTPLPGDLATPRPPLATTPPPAVATPAPLTPVAQATKARAATIDIQERQGPMAICGRLMDRGDVDGAVGAIRAMNLAEFPEHGLFELGQRFQDRARLEVAELLFQEVYAREPQFRDVEIRLQEVREKLARFDEDDVARLLAQRVLHGRFESPELIGRGGMGFVFRVRDSQRHDESMALKILSPFLANEPVIRERFLRESRCIADLKHDNLIRIYDVFEANLPYYTMEFLTGQTLYQILSRNGPLKRQRITHLMVQACQGLAAAHQAGVVHRDLKPDNLMIDAKDHLKVLDFGIARFLEADKLTQTGQLLGTLVYMSPEQLAGAKVDARSDLYSLGLVLHELATGRLPFPLTPAGLPASRPNLSLLEEKFPELTAALIPCLREKPEKRYSSARDLEEVLAALS
jgi:CHASE2 domain-containing sensor protein